MWWNSLEACYFKHFSEVSPSFVVFDGNRRIPQPYMHACIHAHLLMVWVFSKDMYKYKKYTYIHVCVVCFFMFSWTHIPEAGVLSVRFPKEYDHIKFAAKPPKLCTYFIQNSVYLWFFHTSIHTYMHACTHAHLLMVWVFPKICINTNIYIYIDVCVVLFSCFLEFIFRKQRF